MSVEQLNRLPYQGGASLWYGAGSVSLADTVDVASLPVRLRAGFAERPWPVHPLWDKVVDAAYFPERPAVQTGESWTLEVVADNRIQVDGVAKKISGYNLHLFNVLLMTSDWSLRSDEFAALGFAGHVRDRARRICLFDISRQRLREKTAPHELFDNSAGIYHGAYRIHPAMQVVDRR